MTAEIEDTDGIGAAIEGGGRTSTSGDERARPLFLVSDGAMGGTGMDPAIDIREPEIVRDALEALPLSRWAAQSAAAGDRAIAIQDSGRFAVIDMGSNSVRLVVYDLLCRAPVPVFNEKALCGLGRGLSVTGRLDDAAIAETLETVARFAAIARGMAATRIEILATAAVREATNGTSFATQIRDQVGIAMRILSGEDEARLSAYGVVGGIPGARGLMGDLGGGSLELVTLEDPSGPASPEVTDRREGGLGWSVGSRLLGPFTTLPLGPLRLMDVAGGDIAKAEAVVRAHLASIPWLEPRAVRGALGQGDGGQTAVTFYPVGGAWRTLAKLHMHETAYELRVIHHYTITASDAVAIARDVSQRSPKVLAKIPAISRRRAETLPFASLVMTAVLERIAAEQVVFSAYGLREGFLFSELGAEELARDPLIEASREMGRHDNRHPEIGPALFHWLDPVFVGERPEDRRIRLAICLLSDLGWREHPDYRANAASRRVLQAPITGLTHGERAYIALAIYARYGGEEIHRVNRVASSLMPQRAMDSAVTLGLLMRTGYSLSAGVPDLLSAGRLSLSEDRLILTIDPAHAPLAGGSLARRLETAARSMGREPQLTIGT